MTSSILWRYSITILNVVKFSSSWHLRKSLKISRHGFNSTNSAQSDADTQKVWWTTSSAIVFSFHDDLWNLQCTVSPLHPTQKKPELFFDAAQVELTLNDLERGPTFVFCCVSC